MKRFAAVLFLLTTYTAGGRSESVTSSLNASLDSGSMAGTRFSVSFSYDSSQVLPVGESYVQLNSFDFTLLGIQFTRHDIFQGGQAIFHNGALNNVTASFQVILPPHSPVQNITFGFGGPGVIGYVDLSGHFGTGSFTVGEIRVHLGMIVSIRSVESSDVLGGQPGIEIELFSDDEFPVRNQILVLQIGASQFFLSDYPNGDLNTVVFVLTLEEFSELVCGDPVIVQYGVEPSDEVWQIGHLDKSILDHKDWRLTVASVFARQRACASDHLWRVPEVWNNDDLPPGEGVPVRVKLGAQTSQDGVNLWR